MAQLISSEVMNEAITKNKAWDLDSASIRRVVSLAGDLETASGVEFVRMEIGSPGFASPALGIEAEREALLTGCTAKYPSIEGLPALKTEASRFVRAFVGVDVPARSCIPTVGSMQGVMVSMMACVLRDLERDTILFLDPGFSVQKQQAKLLGYNYLTYDIYEHRGQNFERSLREIIEANRVACLIYSNPNNPTWMCLTDSELQVIGALATEYDFVVIEDLAYLCMDFRKNLATPFAEPYQPTVARYTNNFILHLSASKIFSYAGQRVAISAISETLYDREFPQFRERFTHTQFGTTYIYAVLYPLSSGVTHSVQHALAAMMRAACDGKLDFVEQMGEYGRRAARLKAIFLSHGFEIPYAMDGESPIADGFFFTISYPGMTGAELLGALLYYGVSAITLKATGAEKQGLRACTSAIKEHQFELLDARLDQFTRDRGV